MLYLLSFKCLLRFCELTEDEVIKANGKDDVHFDEEYEHNVGYGETFDASYDYGHDADYIDEGGGGGYDDCHDADY